jgi:16S rRNA (cytosine967-C5)-methyltransferase
MAKKKVREVALDILLQIEKNGAYSNLLLNSSIEKNDIDRKDVGLLTELVYGTLQRKDTLEFFLAPFVKKRNKLEPWIMPLLRMSLYQIVYLDRIPERAAIHEAVEIAKRRGHHKGVSGLVNGVLRSIQREGIPSLDTITDEVERISIATSHPKWLVEEWAKQYGVEVTKQICEVNLLPPVSSARVNTMIASVDEMVEELTDAGLEVEKGDLSEDAIVFKSGNIAHTDAFQKGRLSIQDESSMLVARALGVEEGDRILDSCAAPGGKTSHIAELLEGSGQVVSLDLHPHKVKLIHEQAKRLHLENVEAKVLDARKVCEEFEEESFDKILVDAPCSGFGVIRRKPDIKLGKEKTDIQNLSRIQRAILEEIAPFVKKGGKLVYSTCTIEYDENKGVITSFLEEHPEFEWDMTLKERLPHPVQELIEDGQVQILPHQFMTDGFYIACLRKKV